MAWLLLGMVAFALLPWHFQQDLGLLKALPGIFGGPGTASGLVQAAMHGKAWLWLGLLGLLMAGTGAALPASRAQGWLLAGGGGFGLLVLLGGAFVLAAPGLGLGAALVLLALLMLAGAAGLLQGRPLRRRRRAAW